MIIIIELITLMYIVKQIKFVRILVYRNLHRYQVNIAIRFLKFGMKLDYFKYNFYLFYTLFWNFNIRISGIFVLSFVNEHSGYFLGLRYYNKNIKSYLEEFSKEII